MKNLLFLFVLFFALIISTSCLAEDIATKVFKIGAILPLSGPISSLGEGERKGLEIAKDKINSSQSEYKVDILYQDSSAEPAKAISGFNALRTQITVPIVYSSLTSVSQALKGIADKSGVMLLISSTDPGVLSNSKLAVRNFVTSTSVVEEAVKYFLSKGHKNISLLRAEEEWGENAAILLRELSDSAQIKIGAEESISKSDLDIKSVLLRLQAKNPKADAIFLFLVGSAQTTAMQELKKLGLTTPLATVYVCSQPTVLETIGDIFDGNVSLEMDFDADSIEYKEFQDEYYKRNGSTFPEFSALIANDNLQMVVNSLSKGFTKAEDIKADLVQSEAYIGAAGETKFNSLGDAVHPGQVMMIKNGACKPVSK